MIEDNYRPLCQGDIIFDRSNMQNRKYQIQTSMSGHLENGPFNFLGRTISILTDCKTKILSQSNYWQPIIYVKRELSKGDPSNLNVIKKSIVI